jgi:hypothetical protein
MTKRRQFRLGCLFCDGSSGSSQEHIFGDWIGKVLGKVSPQNFSFTALHRAGEASQYSSSRVRQGDALSQKLNGVCKTCNNGWMSKIEEATKPVATPLLLREERKLTPADQDILARWIMLKALVIERMHGGPVAIERNLRSAFMSSQLPVPHTRIYIGTYCGDRTVEFNRFVAYDTVAEKSDAYISFWIIGSLFAIALWSPTEECAFNFSNFLARRLHVIAPASGTNIQMPLPRAMSEACYQESMRAFKSWIASRTD